VAHKNPLLGVIFALAASLLFGINASTTKVIITSGIGAEQVVFIRALSAGLFAFGWALLSNREALRVPIRKLPQLAAVGIIGVGMLQYTYSQAVALLPIGIALLIEYTAVLWVPIVAVVMFKEKVKPQIWLGAILVLGGLAVVANIFSNQLNPLGLLFGVAAAACLTIYFLSVERVQRWLPTNVAMAYGMGFSTLFFLPLANLPNFDFDRLGGLVNLGGTLGAFSVPLWLLLIWLGVMGSFLPMAFSYLSLRHLSATLAGIIATSETVLAFLVALLWLNETITLTQALGGLVVIAGILIAQTSRRQNKEIVDVNG
jgi:drug/metabolite transporter (DMT)-like permease